LEYNVAKEFLKEEYVNKRFEFLKETELEVFLKFRGIEWVITREDIQEFSDFDERKLDYQVTPVECSVCSTDYREHVVIPIETYRRMPILFRLRRIEEHEIVFGDPSPDNLYATIGLASNFFINYFRFNENLFFSSFRRMFRRDEKEEPLDIREFYSRPITIKIYNISEKNINRALIKSSNKIEDCLFSLSYLKNIPLWLAEEWPYKGPSRIRDFRFGESYNGWHLPLNTSYNSDIIRFYQFAMSTDIPELKFLSFYQILEYFFVSVSNEKLYERMEYRLKDPRFTISTINLDRLVQDVISHRRETDETEMLKNVLSKFIDKHELIEFIKSYESYIGKNIYSKRHSVFGVNIEVKLEEGHVISNISKHIKEVRNALVHSTDRYESKIRHIPFTETTKKIEEDIPLLKYLAERVIISSAT